MRPLLRTAAEVVIALGFLALGADLYWSWRAHGLDYRPIGFYLDLIDPRWAYGLRAWAIGWSVQAAEAVSRMLTWPVWAPAFGVGLVLSLLTRGLPPPKPPSRPRPPR